MLGVMDMERKSLNILYELYYKLLSEHRRTRAAGSAVVVMREGLVPGDLELSLDVERCI